MLLTFGVFVLMTTLTGALANAWSAAGIAQRHLPWLILAAPIASLVLGLLILRLCFAQALSCLAQLAACLTNTSWQSWLLGALLVLLALVVGAGIWVMGRLLVLQAIIVQRSVQAPESMQATVAALANRMGITSPRVRLWASLRPVALTCGLWHPTIIVSPWLLQQLDAHELEAVLAHELGHVARHDHHRLWLATWLRDACWYLPASRQAFAHLREAQELACDDLAVQATRHPLALASALAKVWQAGVTTPGAPLVPALVGYAGLETRIARLAALPGITDQLPPRVTSDATALRTAGATHLAVFLALVGCGLMTAMQWLR